MLRSKTEPPRRYEVGNTPVWYPRDLETGTTWMAGSANGWSLCLLNGAFEKHRSNPPYRQSRGKVVLDFFSFSDIEGFRKDYVLDGIEPFTLILVLTENASLAVWELRWDGRTAHWKAMDPRQPGIWSSATLYTPEERRLREVWFEDWLEKNPSVRGQDSILDFHRNAGAENKTTALVMDKGQDRQTISITSIAREETVGQIFYEDLISKTISIQKLAFSNEEGQMSFQLKQ
jgi:hypothetical protein